MNRGGDWVPCRGYASQFQLAGASPTNVVLVEPGQGLAASEVGFVEPMDDIVAERVVGHVDIESGEAGADEVIIIERIRVGLLDATGAAAFFADDFMNAQQANEPFLWQRVSRLDAGQNNNNVVCHWNYSAVDVRVARRLGRDQALFYSAAAIAFVGEPEIFVRLFLRTWGRRATR